jgi:hypothetical protein
MDVPQVAAHLGVEDLVPGPQLEPVEFNFESAGVPHSPAGLFVQNNVQNKQGVHFTWHATTAETRRETESIKTLD